MHVHFLYTTLTVLFYEIYTYTTVQGTLNDKKKRGRFSHEDRCSISIYAILYAIPTPFSREYEQQTYFFGFLSLPSIVSMLTIHYATY